MRLIDADALNMYFADVQLMNRGRKDEFCDTLDDIMDAVDDMPTIDPESLRPKGRWTLNRDGSGTCSECHRTRNDVWDMDTWDNYCSHCSARMEV